MRIAQSLSALRRRDEHRWKRWSEKGVFAQIMMGLAAAHGEEKTVMIDATYLKAHRTATSMGVKKGGVDA